MAANLASPSGVKLIFEITNEDGRWQARLFKNLYGEYSDQQSARHEALKVAADAQRLGHEVEVWDRAARNRLL